MVDRYKDLSRVSHEEFHSTIFEVTSHGIFLESYVLWMFDIKKSIPVYFTQPTVNLNQDVFVIV